MELLLIGWCLIAGGYAVNELSNENDMLAEQADKAHLVELANAQNLPELKVAEFDSELDGDSVAKK